MMAYHCSLIKHFSRNHARYNSNLYNNNTVPKSDEGHHGMRLAIVCNWARLVVSGKCSRRQDPCQTSDQGHSAPLVRVVQAVPHLWQRDMNADHKVTHMTLGHTYTKTKNVKRRCFGSKRWRDSLNKGPTLHTPSASRVRINPSILPMSVGQFRILSIRLWGKMYGYCFSGGYPTFASDVSGWMCAGERCEWLDVRWLIKCSPAPTSIDIAAALHHAPHTLWAFQAVQVPKDKQWKWLCFGVAILIHNAQCEKAN